MTYVNCSLRVSRCILPVLIFHPSIDVIDPLVHFRGVPIIACFPLDLKVLHNEVNSVTCIRIGIIIEIDAELVLVAVRGVPFDDVSLIRALVLLRGGEDGDLGAVVDVRVDADPERIVVHILSRPSHLVRNGDSDVAVATCGYLGDLPLVDAGVREIIIDERPGPAPSRGGIVQHHGPCPGTRRGRRPPSNELDASFIDELQAVGKIQDCLQLIWDRGLPPDLDRPGVSCYIIRPKAGSDVPVQVVIEIPHIQAPGLGIPLHRRRIGLDPSPSTGCKVQLYEPLIRETHDVIEPVVVHVSHSQGLEIVGGG